MNYLFALATLLALFPLLRRAFEDAAAAFAPDDDERGQSRRELRETVRRENLIQNPNDKDDTHKDDARGGEENKEENHCHKDGDTQNDGERGVKILVHDASQ